MLCRGHLQAQGVMDSLPLPIVVIDAEFRVTIANPAFLDSFGVTQAETQGQSLFVLGNGRWNTPELRHLLTKIIPDATAVVDFQVSLDVPGASARTMAVSARRLETPGQRGHEILVTFEDVTERGSGDATKDILLSEMRHRMRNMMSVVRALASQTRAAGRTGEEYRDALLGRLTALAEAQEASLNGGDETDLADLLHRRLEPMGAGRIHLDGGPKLCLASAQVLPFSMILYELATNSLKHGAISEPGGEVRIGWEIMANGMGPMLRLTWRESGGPLVRRPRRRGFGTQLIELCAATSLQGGAELDFDPDGLRATLTMPIQAARLAANGGAAPD